MLRQRPTKNQVLGTACWIFAALWFIFLLAIHKSDVPNLFAAAWGDRGERYTELIKYGLTRPDTIRFTFAMLMAQLALIGILSWTGVALLRGWPSARWCAGAFGVFAVAGAIVNSSARLFWLTVQGELIHVSAFVMDASVILFAVNLCGAVYTFGDAPANDEATNRSHAS